MTNSLVNLGAAPAALPHNIEAEAALLGALMSPGMGWLVERCADRMSAASFFEPIHGRIFDAVQRQHALGKPANPVFVKGYFGEDDFRDLGGIGYLARLTATGEGMIAGPELADQIVDLARRRALMATLSDAHARCGDLTVDIADVESQVDASIDTSHDDSVVEADAATCMAEALADLDAEHVGVLNHRIATLDDLIGELEPGSLTILAARPGMGKTAVAGGYAIGAARAGYGVCFVSIEMSRQQLSGRMIADVSFDDPDSRVPYAAIRDRNLNPHQRAHADEVASLIDELPLIIVDAGTLTIRGLERAVRRQKRRMAARGCSLDLVVVDYLQLLHCDDRKRSAYEAISEISRRLKAIAKDHRVAVLALAQLSREVEKRPDKRPQLSDLRDSGQIEQDADAVVFLLREEYYVRQSEPQNDPDEHAKWEARLDRCRGVIEFILAKRRNGTTGTAKGKFFGVYQAVR